MANPSSPAAADADNDTPLTIEDLCRSSHVDAAWIMELVEQGVIEPVAGGPLEWRFEAVSVVRVAKAKRLERDLSLNPSGIALVLELLDEIEALRARLRATH